MEFLTFLTFFPIYIYRQMNDFSFQNRLMNIPAILFWFSDCKLILLKQNNTNTMTKIDFSDSKLLEKYSSAYTLSDMEIFIFPELFYPLVLANIISPEIWKWRSDPWFADLEKRNFNQKMNRIKQYIIDKYVFNLDLETWGLTTKQKETERFEQFIDTHILRESNALFGYEGDKYYYDMDIRSHFGLDKYTTDIIPYWKTETVEAMSAFVHKEGFTTGAGECVSLSALYAAAMFIVGKIPLEKIFLVATPLHSQNFIAENEGLLTNNRRIVTKNMWFNGSSLSAKARRALENEKITIVSHISGYIHTIYSQATIQPAMFDFFSQSIKKFLKASFTPAIFINFLRHESGFKKCFQYAHLVGGRKHYIALEKIFEYEHTSKNSFSEASRATLLREIEMEEFSLNPVGNRVIINDLEAFFSKNKNLEIDKVEEIFLERATNQCCNTHDNIKEMFRRLKLFIEVTPKLPDSEKKFSNENKITFSPTETRDEIETKLIKHSEQNEMAQLAVYVSRRMDMVDPKPFTKAALERNPVCLEDLKNKTVENVVQWLNSLPTDSIYSEYRLAQPDEVWNFKRGDGLEKAFLLANFIINNHKKAIMIHSDNNHVVLKTSTDEFQFTSSKNVNLKINYPI